MTRGVTGDDEGKTVVNPVGETVGIIASVDDGTAYVDPHPSITDRIEAALGWTDPNVDTYPLDDEHVAAVTDDEVRLREDLSTDRADSGY